jgi:hypothetical protein
MILTRIIQRYSAERQKRAFGNRGAFAGLAVCALLFSVWPVAAQEISVHTSSNNYSRADEMVQQFKATRTSPLSVEVATTGSGAALQLLCDPNGAGTSRTRIAIVAREVTAAELEHCRAAGHAIVGEPLPWPGVVNFIVMRESDAQINGPARQLYEFALGRGVASSAPSITPTSPGTPGASETPSPAGTTAPERWSTEFGEVIYFRDLDGWAIWQFPSPAGSGNGKIFVEGLTGLQTGRGFHTGYWMIYGSSDEPCPTPRTDAEGNSSRNYGRFEVTFLDPDAPSRWQAKWGACDAPPEQTWTGTPISSQLSSSSGTPGVSPSTPSPNAQERVRLGVKVQTVTDEIASSLGMSRATGALVGSVEPNSAAAEGGIAAGDIIWTLNGADISGPRDLASKVAALSAGVPIEIGIVRGGSEMRATVTPKPSAATTAVSSERPARTYMLFAGTIGEIGVTGPLAVMPTNDLTRTIFGMSDAVSGVVVTAIAPGSDAALKLRPGWTIIEAAGRPVTRLGDLQAAITANSISGRPILFRVVTQNASDAVFVTVAATDFAGSMRNQLYEGGIAYDQGNEVPFSTEMATSHLLAAVAFGEERAMNLLSERWRTINLSTREVLQRRLLDAGHYNGAIDGIFGQGTSQALSNFKAAFGG